MNQDIGFAAIAANHAVSGGVVWLTTTPGVNEADSALARWQPEGDAAEQYLVGWLEPGATAAYKLARVSATGTFLEAPTEVAVRARWGQRDDPFRVHGNRDVVWAWFDAAGGAASWAKAAEVRELMIHAVCNARIPILLFQAENDYDLAPSHELAVAMKEAGKPFEVKIFPAFGSTPEDGHSFGYFGGAIWAGDVFRFLDAHCRP